MRCDLAILGGGFAGSLLAVRLAQRGLHDFVLVERRPEAGRGVAYGTPHAAHLLNVPAGQMSAFAEDPGHFRRWAGVEAGAFVPRSLYGDYVAELVQGLPRLHDEAVGCLPRAGMPTRAPARPERAPGGEAGRPQGGGHPAGQRPGYDVRLASGAVLQARRVVVAIGQFPPPPLRPAAGLLGNPFYQPDPWAPAAVAPVAGEVLLVGSGLTAVDLALVLLERGAARVHLASRHARLPLPQWQGPPHRDWLGDTPRRISALMRAFRAEEGDPRAVLDALLPHVPALWAELPWVERLRFMRHARSAWEATRNRLPPPTAARVEELRSQGRLVLHAARVAAIEEGRVELRRGGESHDLAVARVVNCTGPDMLYRRINHPLVLDLIGSGLARPEPLGLGLDTGPDFRLLDEDGLPSRGLFALGAPAKGRWWETMAVAALREQARRLADQVLVNPDL